MVSGSDASPSWLDFLALLEDDDGDVDRDALEPERKSCVRKLDELEHEIDSIEESFEDAIEKACSADDPDPYYREAVSELHRFQRKQSEYEYVAQEYTIVSTLLIIAEQYEDLHESTLDQSDELSDRQRDLALALYRGRHIDRPSSNRWTIDESDVPDNFRGDQIIEKIQFTLRRDLDGSGFPSEYQDRLDVARDVSSPNLDLADDLDHEQKIAWLKQIVDVVLEHGSFRVNDNRSLPDDFPDFSDASVPDEDLPEDAETLSLEDDLSDI
jgi:hypothetical protein